MLVRDARAGAAAFSTGFDNVTIRSMSFKRFALAFVTPLQTANFGPLVIVAHPDFV